MEINLFQLNLIYLFAYCPALTSIVIPDSVTSIGENAFYECKKLSSVTFGNGVQYIYSGAFTDCSFTSLILPASLIYLGWGAFFECLSLEKVEYLGDSSPRYDDENPFYSCVKLTVIDVPSTYKSSNFCGMKIRGASSTQSTSSKSKSTISSGAIVGIVIGVIIFVTGIIVGIFFFLKFKNNKILQPIEKSELSEGTQTLIDNQKYQNAMTSAKSMNGKETTQTQSQQSPDDTMKNYNIELILRYFINNLFDYENDFENEVYIASGGFGSIFRAKEKKTGKICAVKKLPLEIIKEDILKEIHVLFQLNYKTLLSLYGITVTPTISIITEFLPHDVQYYIDLSSKGQQCNDWNTTNKMISVIGIALGMRYLHSKNIFHLDLKPPNVLLDSNFYPRICDFGLSKTKSSSMNSPVGTVRFCAPEVLQINQLKGETFNGEKADVFSYGMTIYSILNDTIPFENLNDYQIIQVYVNNSRPELDNPISKRIDDLIQRCWDHDPNNRPDFNFIVDELLNKDLLEEIQDIDIDKINDLLLFCQESTITTEEKNPNDIIKQITSSNNDQSESESDIREKVREDI